MAGDRAGLVRRIVVGVALAGAVLYALEGGEFSTLDLMRQKRTQARLDKSIDSLQKVVDSLTHYSDLVQHDPATQERIAREQFGMVRGNKEIMYRFTDSEKHALTAGRCSVSPQPCRSGTRSEAPMRRPRDGSDRFGDKGGDIPPP